MRRHPYTGSTILWLIGCLLAVGLLSACSGTSGDEENLEADKGGESGNLGQDDAAEGNGQENFANAESPGGDSAEINSDTADAGGEPPAANALPAEGVNTASGGNNGMFDNSGGTQANAAVPLNGAPTANGTALNNTVANVPLNAAVNPSPPANNAIPAVAAVPANAAALMQTSPPSNSNQLPSAATSTSGLTPRPDGRVRYVKQGGIQIMNAPNGEPVSSLEQGDHPVTWEENGWLKMADGMYLPVDGVSQKGIGRPKVQRGWAH
ncbi:MAG: hypothetical protein FJ146_03040 [Deltaproteobacteria bacterium]|nr:hypothetical protein [Deltaproteobacteria bacterium]